MLNMANAIKKISVQRGHDITRYALSTFGGAGGQHACAVADALGVHGARAAVRGVLSAYGMGLADVTAMRERSVEAELAKGGDAPRATSATSSPSDPRRTARRQGRPRRGDSGGRAGASRVRGHRRQPARPRCGTGRDGAGVRAAYRRPLRVHHADKPPSSSRRSRSKPTAETTSHPARGSRDRTDGGTGPARPGCGCTPTSGPRWTSYRRDDLPTGDAVDRAGHHRRGRMRPPSWIPAGSAARHRARPPDADAHQSPARQDDVGTEVDPVMLELFNNLFMSIAEQMGVRLRDTAHSVNIKERLDFSCALFDAEGNLIANAPHMPVHLGSMGESIKEVHRRETGEHATRRRLRDQRPLPRRHPSARHDRRDAGVRPGRRAHPLLRRLPRPPRRDRRHHPGLDARVQHARSTRRACCSTTGCSSGTAGCGSRRRWNMLTSGRVPDPRPGEQPGRPARQLAANEKGVGRTRRMVDEFGLDVVHAYMGHVRQNAEEAVRRVISALRDGSYRYELDTGAVIEVAVRGGPRGAERRTSTSPVPRRSSRATPMRPHRW